MVTVGIVGASVASGDGIVGTCVIVDGGNTGVTVVGDEGIGVPIVAFSLGGGSLCL